MKYFGIIIVVVIILGGAYFLLGGNSDEPSTFEQGVDAIDRAQDLKDKIENKNKTEYIISVGSSVSYTAQKEFFSKPTEFITGTTNDVLGSLFLDKADDTLSVSVIANPQTLESGNSSRDNYVQDQFTGNITIALEAYPLDNGLGAVSALVPVQLTMNGFTQSVDFQVEANVTEQEIQASGNAVINMRDFNIEPASLANVYTVDEIATISFVLKAE